MKNPRTPRPTVPDLLILRLATAALIATIAGCGYHFGAEGSGLPPQAKTIYVERFSNHSRYNGMDDQFDRFLKDEIAQHKRLELVDGSWTGRPRAERRVAIHYDVGGRH